MLLKLRFRVNWNSTLSAMLFKNKQVASSTKVHNGPTRRACFVFGMSDMQFCKAQLRAVKAKTD